MANGRALTFLDPLHILHGSSFGEFTGPFLSDVETPIGGTSNTQACGDHKRRNGKYADKTIRMLPASMAGRLKGAFGGR